MGAGRSEFLECVMGRHPLASGRIFIDGKPVRERDVGGRIARGLALIPEDRQRDGLVPILSVAENLTMASLRKLDAGLPHSGARARPRQVQARGARPVDQGRRPRSARLVALGRKPAEGGDRQGADDRAQGAADGRAEPRHRHRRQGATCSASCAASPRKGIGILFVTSDLDEVLALSDRIAVMSQGPPDRAVRPRRGERSQDRRRLLDRPWPGRGAQHKELTA